MATNDLMSELQKDSIKLDDDSERKVVKMILKLLEDKNGEVQNLAVKWYWLDCACRISFLFFLCSNTKKNVCTHFSLQCIGSVTESLYLSKSLCIARGFRRKHGLQERKINKTVTILPGMFSSILTVLEYLNC